MPQVPHQVLDGTKRSSDKEHLIQNEKILLRRKVLQSSIFVIIFLMLI